MNGATSPMRARRSVSAQPIHMYSVLRPLRSGCPAMASIAWPKTRPMPVPGPMAARPYPRAPRRWMSMTWVPAAARSDIVDFPLRSVRRFRFRFRFRLPPGWLAYGTCRRPARPARWDSAGLVTVLQRVRDIRRGQGGEDEGLQEVDKQFQQEDEEHHEERAGRVEQANRQAHHVPGGDHENAQQQVAGEHVREEPDAEGERLDDHVLEDLDRDQ